MLDATISEMVILTNMRIGSVRFIAFMLAISRGPVLEKIYLFRRLLKYRSGSRCCGFWRWPRREAQCRYPQRSRPSKQPGTLSGPKSTQPLRARGRRAAGPEGFRGWLRRLLEALLHFDCWWRFDMAAES